MNINKKTNRIFPTKIITYFVLTFKHASTKSLSVTTPLTFLSSPLKRLKNVELETMG